MKGKLVLEDGSVFEGSLLGGAPTVGEVVFNTGYDRVSRNLDRPILCGSNYYINISFDR